MHQDAQQRRVDLIHALRSLRDVSETLQRGDSGGKFTAESRLLTMPSAWHAGCPRECIGRGGNDPRACNSTYARLVLALMLMRSVWPTHHWHVSQRYLDSERLSHELVRVVQGTRPRYWEAIRRDRWDGDTHSVRYSVGDRLPANVEVLSFVQDLRAPISRREGIPPTAVLVWAAIEWWNERVRETIVKEAVDGLLQLMPERIELPAAVA
jgi:hypothetical protein